MRKVLVLLVCVVAAFAAGFAVAYQQNNPLYAAIRNVVVAIRTPAPPSTVPHWRGRTDLFGHLALHADFVMAGDSLIANAEWGELFPSANIVNRGISGDGLAGLQDRAEQIIAMRPKRTFLMVGINDLRTGRPASWTIDHYIALVDHLSGHTDVVVQSTLFTADRTLNRAAADLNSAMASYCEASQHCSFLDLNSVIAPEGYLPEDMTVDGLHLTGAAYLKWREAIRLLVEQSAGSDR